MAHPREKIVIHKVYVSNEELVDDEDEILRSIGKGIFEDYMSESWQFQRVVKNRLNLCNENTVYGRSKTDKWIRNLLDKYGSLELIKDGITYFGRA
jgi:hypothetical protein